MKQILKRLGTMCVTVLMVSMLAFFVFQIIPGDAALTRLGTDATDEQIEALRKEYGLDDPIYTRYYRWLSGAVHGDFGKSYAYDMSVSELVNSKIQVTMWLAIESFLFILGISIPLGIFLARYAKKPVGVIGHIFTQIIMAVPSFFVGVLIVLIFGLILKWFTPYQFVNPEENFLGFLGCLLPGAFAIAIPKIAMVVRFLRTGVLDEQKKDYVRTAYSKGCSSKRVFYRHILKNAILPVITIIGMTVAEIMAGSIVIEQVFNYPGLGRLLVSSINRRDFPTVQFIMLYIACIVIIMNTIVDVLYQVVDPRINLEE